MREGMCLILREGDVAGEGLPVEFHHFAGGLGAAESGWRNQSKLVGVRAFEGKGMGGLRVGELDLSSEGNRLKGGVLICFQGLEQGRIRRESTSPRAL
jgi:hypothetical protein